MRLIQLKVFRASAILDKLGEKRYSLGKISDMFSYHSGLNRITYEEVIDDTRPIQSKKGPWS